MGSGCRLFTNKWGSEPFLIEIGDYVTVSSEVLFVTHDGATWLVRDDKGRRHAVGGIRVGSHVFIGARSTILPNVTIGDRVIIGAASVVTKSVPSNSVVAGNPARYICSFDDYEKHSLEKLPSDADMAGTGHEARSLSVLNRQVRPYLRDTQP